MNYTDSSIMFGLISGSLGLSMSEYVFSEESGSGEVSVVGPAGFRVRVVSGIVHFENALILLLHTHNYLFGIHIRECICYYTHTMKSSLFIGMG